MYYESALQFFLGTLKKCGVPASTVRLDNTLAEHPDIGFQLMLQRNGSLEQLLGAVAPATVYSLSNHLGCNYIYFRLPETSQSMLLIGPYLDQQLSEKTLFNLAEQEHLPPKTVKQLKAYFSGLSIIPDSSPLYQMMDQFYEVLWGSGGYKTLSVGILEDEAVIPGKNAQNADILLNARVYEQRYAIENALIDAVTKGQLQTAERRFARFSPDFLEQRTPDTLRNMKNYCVIMNTLLRKAVEQGGVHPSYIDRISSDMAIRIEKLPNLTEATALMKDMLRSYCLLVQNQAVGQYSPLIKNAILIIDSDLSADLRLRTLAEKLNVSGSYLSSLFKKQTGQTVTEFISTRRIRQAKHLLRTTGLQIQTVAQHCGFPDVNYFSKTFKKLTGTSPRTYRCTGE